MIMGIDFGTCYSSAAIIVDGRLEMVKDPLKHGYSFPSSIYVSEKGDILVGSAAENLRRRDPSRYKREFKRDLRQNIPYQIGNLSLLPEQLIAELLKELKNEAEKSYGKINEAVITVPATYDMRKRELMKKVGEEVGFKVDLLEEPVAAAIYYTNSKQKVESIKDGEILLVYDLGGGTFDVAIIRKKQEGYENLAMPLGLEQCGGIDFDRKIYVDIKQQVSADLTGMLDAKSGDIASLRARLILADFCREIKHQLSKVEEVEDLLALPKIDEQEYKLSRENFNKMIEPMLEETCDLSKKLLSNAGLKIEQVKGILMVGGSCRIPYVKEKLEKELKIPAFQVQEPELAVCQGAAIYGNKLRETVAKPLHDVNGLVGKPVGHLLSEQVLRFGVIFGSPSIPINKTEQKQKNTFEFETVKVDIRGNIIERKKGQANQYIEDLGNGIKLEMVEVPAGTFLMGSASLEVNRRDNEGPQHQVTVPKFYIGKYPVTQEQYQAIMGYNPSYFTYSNKLPVEQVSWYDAIKFCDRLSAKTGKAYRLPSEAEWEYACRAGTTTPFAFGESISRSIVNYDDQRETVPVGSLGVANAFGVYDMHGNILEWCQDTYQDSYNSAPTNGSAWEKLKQNRKGLWRTLLGDVVDYRIARGGSWCSDSGNCRSAARFSNAPDYKDCLAGFRVCFS